jgi:hypothetical protein
MKKNTILKSCGFAALLILQCSHAQALSVVTNGASIQNGDLLLAVNSTNTASGNDLLIDLGQYANLTPGSIDISADLATASLSGTLYYGVFAVTDANYVYATTPTLNQIYSNLSAPNARFAQGNYLQPLGVGGANVGTLGYDRLYSFQTTANGGYISSADVNSWTVQNPNVSTGPGFGFTQYAVESPVGSIAYLDRTTTSGTGAQVGSFNLTAGGTLSFAAVPEPSTYALMGLSALVLVIAYRRKVS